MFDVQLQCTQRLLLYKGLMMDLRNLKHVAKIHSKRIHVLL